MGKNKIEIKEIQNPNSKQVCFSKRRMGIFKKASELAILCGAEIAIIVYSPAGKAFTFGCPDIDFVLDKYQNVPVNIDNEKVQRVLKSEKQYNHVLRELEAEKKVSGQLKRGEMKNDQSKPVEFWWKKDIENLNLSQLLMFSEELKAFRQNVIKTIKEENLAAINIASSQLMPLQETEATVQRPPQQSSYFHFQCADGDYIASQQWNQMLETSASFDSTSGHYQLCPWDEGIAKAPAPYSPWMINTHAPAYCPGNPSSLFGQASDTSHKFVKFNPPVQQFNPSMQHYFNNAGAPAVQQCNPTMQQFNPAAQYGNSAIRRQYTSHRFGVPSFSNIYMQPSSSVGPDQGSFLPPFAEPSSDMYRMESSERQFGSSHDEDDGTVDIAVSNNGNFLRHE